MDMGLDKIRPLHRLESEWQKFASKGKSNWLKYMFGSWKIAEVL
jgi:hypothetical protein